MANVNYLAEENLNPGGKEVLESLKEILQVDGDALTFHPGLGAGANAFLGQTFAFGKKIPVKGTFNNLFELGQVADFDVAIKELGEEHVVAIKDLNDIQTYLGALLDTLYLYINVIQVNMDNVEEVIASISGNYDCEVISFKDFIGEKVEECSEIYEEIINKLIHIEHAIESGKDIKRYEGRLSEECRWNESNPIPLDLMRGVYFARSITMDGIGTLDVFDFEGNPNFKLTNDGKLRTFTTKGLSVELPYYYGFKLSDWDVIHWENVLKEVEKAAWIVDEYPIHYYDRNYEYEYATK